jgi:hypothetical protein
MFRRIIIVWLAVVLLAAAFLAIIPNEGPSPIALLIEALFILGGLICLAISFKEPVKANKPIFVNFTAFFFLAVIAFIYSFMGYSFLIDEPVLKFYVYQYHMLAHFFLLSFSVVYVVVDSLFTDFRTYRKYLITLLIVGGTFSYYYHPVLQNPKYLAHTDDWIDYNAVQKSVFALKEVGNAEPTSSEIAAITDLGAWKDGERIGTLFSEEKVHRTNELLPYMRGNNEATLFYRPLYLSNIYMNVLCVVFIFLFFGYQYKNDPPQGAYLEKIIFLFLPYCSLEILHHYAYIKSVEYEALLDVQQVGGYLTLANLVLLLFFFGLRLRFITSVKGEFYERELVSDAEHISRWRDSFDNLVVRHFLNPKAIHGRLFAPRTPRNEA